MQVNVCGSPHKMADPNNQLHTNKESEAIVLWPHLQIQYHLQ